MKKMKKWYEAKMWYRLSTNNTEQDYPTSAIITVFAINAEVALKLAKRQISDSHEYVGEILLKNQGQK